ncbi:MAG: inositol monophosphatase [Bacteroides sp.]|nr:inositol monophosphatase [Bacteroides sp.]
MISETARETCIRALKSGGQILMDHYGSSTKTIVKKSISSVVTEADLASEKTILKILEDDFPGHNVITEETGYIHKDSAYTWVVDPLDGTSNFAAGLPWFGVIISLFKDNTPVMGGMYLPVDDCLYMAESGKGAWKNGEAIRTTNTMATEDVLVAYSFDFSAEPGKTRAEMEVLERLSFRVRNIRSTNSLVEFCFTADGRLGAALNQTTKIWDIAAPWLIITEAGGKVTDIKGEEIQWNLSMNPCEKNYTILASGKALHTPLLNITNAS